MRKVRYPQPVKARIADPHTKTQERDPVTLLYRVPS